MAVPTLAAFQFWFGGLLMGDGTPYDVVQIDGIDTMPDVPQPDVKIDRDWGDYMGAYYSKGREITITLAVHDTTDAAFRADLDNLGAATIPNPLTESPFAWLLPGMVQIGRQANCRSHHRAVPTNLDYVFHKAKVECSFYATDPRIYDVNTQTATTGLPTGTGGTSWPITWPLSWGTAAPGGTVTCTNAGTMETRPLLTITGPIDNPTVQNTTTGGSMSFGITLGNTDVLTIDMNNKLVQLNGGGNLRGTVSAGTWWDLIPGANVVQFSANTTHVGSQLTVAFQSAWL